MHEFVAEVGEMGDRPAEGGQAEAQEGDEDFTDGAERHGGSLALSNDATATALHFRTVIDAGFC
ncbi:hypothetical protein SDC9_146141 [bioreactor metagenome]|uniref:Uncharacterized protein n=1 Tax=bioreactor metagenome TaxID=1076179 RepID=A0A645EC86_9ZZZZ